MRQVIKQNYQNVTNTHNEHWSERRHRAQRHKYNILNEVTNNGKCHCPPHAYECTSPQTGRTMPPNSQNRHTMSRTLQQTPSLPPTGKLSPSEYQHAESEYVTTE